MSNYDQKAKKAFVVPFKAIDVPVDDEVFLMDLAFNRVFGEDTITGQTKNFLSLKEEVNQMIAQNPELSENITFEGIDKQEQAEIEKLEKLYLKRKSTLARNFPSSKEDSFLQILSSCYTKNLSYEKMMPTLELFHRRLELFHREINQSGHLDEYLKNLHDQQKSEHVHFVENCVSEIMTTEESALEEGGELGDGTLVRRKVHYRSFKKRMEEEAREQRRKNQENKKRAELQRQQQSRGSLKGNNNEQMTAAAAANSTTGMERKSTIRMTGDNQILRRKAMRNLNLGNRRSEMVQDLTDLAEINSSDEQVIQAKIRKIVSKNAKNLLQYAQQYVGNPKAFENAAMHVVQEYAKRIQYFEKFDLSNEVPKLKELKYLDTDDVIMSKRNPIGNKRTNRMFGIRDNTRSLKTIAAMVTVPFDSVDNTFISVIDHVLNKAQFLPVRKKDDKHNRIVQMEKKRINFE